MEKITQATTPKKVEIPAKISHTNIYQALSAFQGDLKPMAKTGHVEYQTSKGLLSFEFTPLGEIMATIYPLLAKHGLSVRHEVSTNGVEAILTHETYNEKEERIGEDLTSKGDAIELLHRTYTTRISNQIRSGIVKISQGGEMKDMKDTGASITYARRYTLTMVLGISSEEDKDVSLLEQTAQNAMMNVMSMGKKRLENAKTETEVKKVLEGFEKDLKQIEAGKAPALGLKKEQYQDLIGFGTARIKQIKEGIELDQPTLIPDEQ